MDRAINLYYERSKGDGARKLYKTITQVFCGVSERKIQAALNRSAKRQELKPTFSNKSPLKPVQASSAWQQVQADLVSMEHMPGTVGETTYKYVLSVIDVFSRFLILRPVTSKSASEIADILTGIFAEHGAPQRFQTDQGTEFKGAVEALMSKLKVHIIRSRPYHPQSQGKDERSHRTWKDYLSHDLKEDPQTNWVTNLPVYMSLYNASPHSAIGHKTPFEVHFGRTPLTVTKPLLSDPRGSNSDDSESHDSDLPDYFSGVRTEAKKSSERAATLMIQQQLTLNPPSLYDIGDGVVVRLPLEQRKKKSKKIRRMVYKGIVVKADHDKHMYIVTYEDAGQYRTGQFSVGDMTSESLTVEKQRTKAAVARPKQLKKTNASKTKSKRRQKSRLPTQTTSQTDSTMFKVKTRFATYDFRYSDLRTITTHNAWLSDANVSTFIYLLRNHKNYATSPVNILPVEFYEAVRGDLKSTADALWQDYLVTEKCQSPAATGNCQLLCIPILESSHFFVIVVDVIKHTMEILDSRQSSDRSDKYLMATSIISQYLNRKLPACAYSYTIRSGLPQQPNSSDCGVFVCRYLNELVNRYYFAFDRATTHNRRWLAQFMLDEAMNQAPTVEIISTDPTGLNSTSGVTYLCTSCSVSIPDVFFDKHQSLCASNPDAIKNIAFTRPKQASCKMAHSTPIPVVDLTRSANSKPSAIDLTCTSPSLSMSSDAEGNPSAGVPTPQGTSDTATVHTESGHGMSSDTDKNGTHGNKSGSDYTPPPSPILDMSVLDCQLGLKERDWEITK